MALIETHGPSNWMRISQLLVTRTPKQCRERYHQNLKPSLNHSPITDEEGLYIEQLVQRYGKKWAEIARHLNGRSDNAVKNWWNGGANRRRRASVTSGPRGSTSGLSSTANGQQQQLPQQQQQQQQQHQEQQQQPPHLPQQQGPGSSSTLPAINPHIAAAATVASMAPSPAPPSLPPLEYNYPSVGHRVSLPNIYSDYPNHHPPPPPRFDPQHQQQPAAPAGAHPGHQNLPPVVFNSAYTADSSGFRKSSTVAASTPVDPRAQDTQGPAPLSRSPYPTRKRLSIYDDAPFSRRLSASAAVPSSSSRTSSLSGISNSDAEDPLSGPLLSLSKYSLSNSGSSSRTNSYAVPTEKSGRSTPLLTPHAGSIPPPILSYHRHSVSGYPDPLDPVTKTNSSTPVSSGGESSSGTALSSTNSTTTAPANSSSSQSTASVGPPGTIANSTPSASPSTSSDDKIKISNLLS